LCLQVLRAVTNTPRRDRGAGLDACFVVFVRSRLDAIAQTTPRLSGFGAGRNPRSDGRCAEHRHQWIVGGKWIFVHRNPLALEASQNAPSRPGQYPGQVLGLGRRQSDEGAGVR